MPGPKMGTRAPDFDESVVRKAPTFQKWLTLKDGQKIRYACRDFVKGHGQDEERLMRRIMIARRNNVRDHELLKQAREITKDEPQATSEAVETPTEVVAEESSVIETIAIEEPPVKQRKIAPSLANAEDDMDERAVKATRSYKAWLALDDGKEFSYNQKYIKGKEGHDFLLKKNIWRRMRYRRENKKMVDKLRAKTGWTVPKNAPKKGTKKHPATSFYELDATDTIDVVGSASVSEGEEKIDATEDRPSFLDAIGSSSMPTLDTTTLDYHGSALEAAYKLAAATANAEEVAAAVAAAIQDNDDDDEEEEEDDDLLDEDEKEDHYHEESSLVVEDDGKMTAVV